MTKYFGVDLAWGSTGTPKESGLAVIDQNGTVLDASWARGVAAVKDWIVGHLGDADIIAIDAPLVVLNALGQREAEWEVGKSYSYPWYVSAHSTNLAKRDLAGVRLREELETIGVRYVDGTVPFDGISSMFECYPYTTIVGTADLAYDVRPPYKKLDRRLPAPDRRVQRALVFEELVRRVASLESAIPPVRLSSHPVTRALIDDPTPSNEAEYKHREDLLDAVLCAWTAALWHIRGERAVQVLGRNSPTDDHGRRATIIAPAKPEQRRIAGTTLAEQVVNVPNRDGDACHLALPNGTRTRGPGHVSVRDCPPIETMSVVAAIIQDDGRILACRRAPHKSEAGRWEFPGGKVEPGESFRNALERELYEELGVTAIAGAEVGRSLTSTGSNSLLLVGYFASLNGDLPTSSTDHDDLRWLLPRQLEQLDWNPPDLAIVHRLRDSRPS